MKRLFFILSLLFAMQISAQTEIIIGDTASNQSSSNLPISIYYKYSYSQSIYKQSELVAGEISSISYYHVGENYSAGTISIYFKETSDSTLSGFSPADGFTQVFTGALNLTNGWVTFVFPEIFEYSGQNNLIIAVIKSHSEYSWGHNFMTISANSSSIYRESDYASYTLSTTSGSGGIENKKPIVKFGIFPSEDYCYPPIDIFPNTITPNQATISWNIEDESSSVFGLAYKTDADEDWTIASDGIQDTFYTLTNLIPYTKYHFRLWTICPASNSFERSGYFMTAPNESCYISLSYDENFDDDEDLWQWRYTNYGENRWYVGGAVNNTRDEDGYLTQGKALYISNNGGLNNTYNNTVASTSYFSTLIHIQDSTYYGIEFDYKMIGEGSLDRLTVFLLPLYAELTTNISGATTIGTLQNTSNAWRKFEQPFPENISEGDYQLVFCWKNDNNAGQNPPAAIDNLKVHASLCARVTDFTDTIADVDGNASMSVNINDTINQTVSYIVEYRLSGESIWDTIQDPNPVEISYLPYSSIIEYRVIASCGSGGNSMPSDIVKVVTPCGLTHQYPYKEYFETDMFNSYYDISQYCWKTINEGDQWIKWGYSSSNGIKGSGALNYPGSSYYDNVEFNDWIISPAFALDGNQRLNFQYKIPQGYNTNALTPKIDVYIYNTDIVDYSSVDDTIYFEYLTTINDTNVRIEQWKMAEILLGDYVGNFRFALVVKEANPTFIVDNFVVSNIPDCFEVYGLEVEAYSGTSVSITYETANVSGTGVAIAYAQDIVNQNFDPESADWQIISGDEELPYILEGLEPGQTYIFAASQTCGGEWSDTVKATLPMPYSTPFSFDFNSSSTTPEMQFTASSAQNIWFIGNVYNSTIENPDSTQGGALYITNDNGASASYTPEHYNGRAYLNVNFAGASEYQLSFDWMCEGSGTIDYLKVYLIPFGDTLSENFAITGRLNQSIQWQREEIILPAHLYAGGYQLVFEFNIGGGNLNQYHLSAIIDNITIDTNDCARIVELELEPLETDNGANLIVGLLDQFNTEASYVLRYKKSTDDYYSEITGLTREAFPYTLSNGIEYQTNYQLQIGVICQQGDMPYFNEEIFSINTPCVTLQTPWQMEFDENILEPQYCWQLYNGFPSIYDTTYTSDLSPNSSWAVGNVELNGIETSCLKIELSHLESKEWVISPSINIGDGSVTKQIIFNAALRAFYSDASTQAGDDDKLIIMVSTDNGETWSVNNRIVFKDNDTDIEHNFSDFINQPTPISYKLVDEDNQPLTGQIKIAFYVESTTGGTYNVFCIDNISVIDWNECQSPQNPMVAPADIRHNSAIVNFTTLNNNANYFEYVLVEGECSNFDTLPTLTASETSISLTELSDATLYTFAIRSICSEDMVSPWAATTFTTLTEPMSIPFVSTFSDSVQWFTIDNAIGANAWSFGSATSVDPNGSSAYISNDGGNTYAADLTTSNTIAFLWQDIAFGETENAFELSFDWKCLGNVISGQVYGGISIYLLDIAPLSVANLPSDSIITLYGAEQWQSERLFLGNITGNKRLVIASYGYRTQNELTVPAAIDNIELITSPCPMVEWVTVENISTNSIDLSWTETGADNYIISYRDDFSTQEMTMTTTENNATIQNLSSATTYYIKVKGVCGGAESIASQEITVTTQIEVATLPYSCDFEGQGTNGWLIKNGTCTNKWWVGDVNSSTNSALFVTGDNGITSAYDNMYSSVVIAEKQIQLGQTDSIRISFDLKVGGHVYSDYLKVFFVPVSTNFEPATYTNNFATSNYSQGVIMSNSESPNIHTLSMIPQTQNMSVTIPNELNEVRKLVFVWVNNYLIADNQGAVIDNVLIEGVGDIITCVQPVANSVTATNVLQTTAEISWQDNDESHNAWNVYYKSEYETEYNVVTVANQTSVTLTDLSLYTKYNVFVKTNCGEELSRSTDTIQFHTLCEPVTEFPYFTGFENSDLDCWIAEGNRDYVWRLENNDDSDYSTPNPYEGNQYVYFKANEESYSTFISPILNIDSMANPYVKFSYYTNYSQNYENILEVLYRENQSSEWILLRSCQNTGSVWKVDSLSLPNQTSSYQIAFKTGNYYSSGVSLDAISVYDAEVIDQGSLTDVGNANQLQTTLYPNPANNQATLRVENLNSSAKVIISDTQGRILREEKMNAGEKELTLNLKGLKSGIYYIKLKTDKAVSTQKLIVE